MSRPWMPLYVSDYLGDTRRLTTLEHGAYLLLIMEYWQHGSLPTDDAELADIAGLEQSEWERIRPRISRLFQDGWKHKRIEAELAKAADISERRKASAERRWSKSNANALQEEETCNAHARVPQPQPQPQSQSHTTSLRSVGGASTKRSKARSAISEDAQPGEPERLASESAGLSNAEFRDEWRKFRDHHRAKGSLMADWSAAWRTWLGNRDQFRPARAGPAPAKRNGFAALAVKLYGNNDGKRTQNGSFDQPVLMLPVNAHGERGTGCADDASLPRKAGDGFG